ncbi:YjjG family noncanonical pyrimidine nucleotidase [Carnobacterium sp. TMP28]|uniref:YjjG family noncanonical pyrimidine nucleotidase n=1 Tax=Carnobacterium sp. TMP28 TaxID=3397060 RepID=UPI0039E0AFD6
MKHYHFLLFDIDDTILDFKATENSALTFLFEQQGIILTNQIKDQYEHINHSLWQAFERNEIDRNAIFTSRFPLLFKELGFAVDGLVFEKNYRCLLNKGDDVIDGSLNVLKELSLNHSIYAVTNGMSKTQYQRMESANLLPLFKDIFVSEDTGYQKPMQGYFDYVFERIPNFSIQQSLIIGDSLSSDILGGKTVGMDTCWFNPNSKPTNPSIQPTYQIKKLDQLYDIVSKKELLPKNTF